MKAILFVTLILVVGCGKLNHKVSGQAGVDVKTNVPSEVHVLHGVDVNSVITAFGPACLKEAEDRNITFPTPEDQDDYIKECSMEKFVELMEVVGSATGA